MPMASDESNCFNSLAKAIVLFEPGLKSLPTGILSYINVFISPLIVFPEPGLRNPPDSEFIKLKPLIITCFKATYAYKFA
jgi:hypothetical protein